MNARTWRLLLTREPATSCSRTWRGGQQSWVTLPVSTSYRNPPTRSRVR